MLFIVKNFLLVFWWFFLVAIVVAGIFEIATSDSNKILAFIVATIAVGIAQIIDNARAKSKASL